MAYDVQIMLVLSNSRFATGHLVASESVDALVREGRLNPIEYLRRHVQGDWGAVTDAEWDQNQAALTAGQGRLFSTYQVAPDLNLWIITEADRSITSMLLPGEY